MKVSLGRIAAVAVAALTIGYGVAEFRRPDGYTGFTHKREEARRLDLENRKLRDEIERESKRIEKLKNDPVAQELEVRRRLALVKEGETVYLLQDKAKK